jgi:hypothetical protein
MKKYIIILVSFFFLFPPVVHAGLECVYTWDVENHIPGINKIEKSFFKKDGYLVIFYYYETSDPTIKDNSAKLHFKNIVSLAEKKWGKSFFDVNDFWDENERPRPYILVELGGTVLGKLFYTINNFAIVETCYDRQIKKPSFLSLINCSYYDFLLNNIEEVFIPILALEDEMEKML